MGQHRLGNYDLQDQIGQGGVATVWRARHRFLGTEHALKVLSRPSPKALTRLMREGRVQAQLQHPNIVPVRDIILDDERVALAMPLIAGGTLEDVIADRGPLPWKEALALFQPILEAVAHAHGAGVLHRDIKPQNVLMQGGIPKVADFGIARVLAGEDDPNITRAGSPMGTLGFCSPEQWASASDVDERADVFSLAALLFWMLTGTAPFDESSPTNTLRNTLTGQHPDLRRVVPDCPEQVVAAIHRALRPKPTSRQSSARIFGEQLGLSLTEQVSATLIGTEHHPNEAPSKPRSGRTTGGSERLSQTSLNQASVTSATPGSLAPAMPLYDTPPAAGLLRGHRDANSSSNSSNSSSKRADKLIDPLGQPPPPGQAVPRTSSTTDSAPPHSTPPHSTPLRDLRQRQDTFLDDSESSTTDRSSHRVFWLAAALMVCVAGAAVFVHLQHDRGPQDSVDSIASSGAGMAAAGTHAPSDGPGPDGAGADEQPLDEQPLDEQPLDEQPLDEQPTMGADSTDPDPTTASQQRVAESTSAGSDHSHSTPARVPAQPAQPTPDRTTQPTDIAAAGSACSRQGGASLGFLSVSRSKAPRTGDRIKIKEDSAVQLGRRNPSGVNLASGTRCTLTRGERVEVLLEPTPAPGDSWLVEVFPSGISGR